MEITINIGPEAKAELARQASVYGMELSAFAAILLEHIVRPRLKTSRTMEEFEQTLDRIAQFSDKIPVLPDQAFSRENFYPDHD